MSNIDYAIQELANELDRSSWDTEPEFCGALEEAITALNYRRPIGLVGDNKAHCPKCGVRQDARRLPNGSRMVKFCKECGQAFLD